MAARAAAAAAVAAVAAGTAVAAGAVATGGGRLSCDEAALEDFYQLPEPSVVSRAPREELWQQYGVNVVPGQKFGVREFAPQPSSAFRPLGAVDEERLRDMRGQTVPSARNPGVRFLPNFLEEDEEAALAEEVQELVRAYGSVMKGARSYGGESEDSAESAGGEPQLVMLPDGRIGPDPTGALGPMRRITGRSEGGARQRPPPWGYGAEFRQEALPPRIAAVASRIQSLEGFPLGPLRDVTINSRTSMVCRLDPHIDPLTDGANCFILTLLSGAVITFSPVSSLKREASRATTPATFGMRSFTDDDVDGLLRRRSLCHFAGDARYRWSHAIRPGVAVELTEQDDRGGTRARACICDWWGSHANILPRKDERISIIFAFADPWRSD